MKLFYISVLILFSACNSYTPKDHKEKREDRKTKTLPKKSHNRKKNIVKSSTNPTLEWIKANAISINPDIFPNQFDRIYLDNERYKVLDSLKLSTLISEDSLFVKMHNAITDEENKRVKVYIFDLFSHPVLFPKLCDVYLDTKKQVKAFTIIYLGAGGMSSLLFVSLDKTRNKIKDIVEIAYKWGDMGIGWQDKSAWLNDSTLIKSMQTTCFDSTTYKANININLKDNGSITFSKPKVFIQLSAQENALLFQQKSDEYFGKQP